MGEYFYDPWSGMKEGTQTLRQAWKDKLDAEREAAVTRQLGLSSDLHALQIDEAKRKIADREQRAKMLGEIDAANKNETARYNSDVGAYGKGLADYGNKALAIETSQFPPAPTGNPSDIAGLQSQVAKYPGLAALSGSGERLAAMQQPDMAGSLANAQSAWEQSGIQPPTPPTPPKLQNPMDALFAIAMKSGDYDEITNSINLSSLIAKNSPDQISRDKALANLESVSKVMDLWGKLAASGHATPETKAYLESAMNAAMPSKGGERMVLPDSKSTSTIPAVSVVDKDGNVIAQGTTDDKGNFHIANAPEKWSDPYTATVGGKQVIVRKNLTTNKVEQVVAGPNPVNVSVNAPQPNEVDSLAASVVSGDLDPNSISKRGGLQAKVYTRVKQMAPGFSFTNATANAKFRTSTANLNSRAILDTIDPLLNKLAVKGKELGNFDIPVANRPINWIKENLGYADIVGFNNLRDDVIAEVERGLLGTGVLSDNKYNRALKNVNSAQSYPQLQEALKNIRSVIAARLDALGSTPYETNPQDKSNVNTVKPQTSQKQIDMTRPVAKGNMKGYRQPDGSVVDAQGKRLN